MPLKRNTLPPPVEAEARARYGTVMQGLLGWIAIDRAGHLYQLDVIQTGPENYDFDALVMEAVCIMA